VVHQLNEGYYWVRVFDYVFERDTYEKGVVLDEFYLKDIASRDEAKEEVKTRYSGDTLEQLRFAKPKQGKDGVYVILMDSNKFFYDRFYAEIDTCCFWCHDPIKGKACEFPHSYIGEGDWYGSRDDIYSTDSQTAYFCEWECKRKFTNSQRKDAEGEFQAKEEGQNGEVFGYIYLIYNRRENVNYIGQTRFLPFFRWQEHIKEGKKGDISDLSFSVITEVRRHIGKSEEENKHLLNSMEAWWINKFEHERKPVVNITKPKITIAELKERFNDMVTKEARQIAMFL
jgi:hypothetical protein